MTLFAEKRKLTDRRIHDDGPPSSQRERRQMADRRQVTIAEIPLSVWVAHVLRFQRNNAANDGRVRTVRNAHA